MNRFVCIHGHFYQPPRENPWLEWVELQNMFFSIRRTLYEEKRRNRDRDGQRAEDWFSYLTALGRYLNIQGA